MHDQGGPENKRASKRIDWWAEIRGLIILVVAVLGFHSLIAKPFYIPTESMVPTLQVGDRLVVTKYPYGYSYVTPTFHFLPEMKGRLFGTMPERGDIVIVTPPGTKTDYIKRVIGLPGERIAIKSGIIYLNGKAVKRTPLGTRDIPVDVNSTCNPLFYPGARRTVAGKTVCRVPIYRETLPNGRSYDIIDIGPRASHGDEYPEIRIPRGHLFLMGDNRDNSADSRYPLRSASGRLEGLGGPIPWENIGGRAEFITFSLDGSASYTNPLSWFASFREGRAGTSLHPSRESEQ